MLGAKNKNMLLAGMIIVFMMAVSTAYAVDADGDMESPPNDCDDFDYYTFTGAVNIPYDIIPNDCYWSWDSTIKDINDPAPPSSNSTYYIGENVTIVSTRMNKPFFIAIVDSENRTYNFGPSENKITDLDTRDVVWSGTLIPEGGILGVVNKTILLPDLEKHPPGIYTIYLWFVAYGGGDAGTQEYIPIETFTVVEKPTCMDSDADNFTTCDGDCNDNDASINPNATDTGCDGIDNNCNNQTDEGYVPTATQCGTGECAETGQLICVNGTTQNTCSSGSPGDEICDNLDNDCDGQVDENLTQSAGQPGVCDGNTQTCQDGAWINNSETEPAEESCDNMDNDCDGQTDEGLEVAFGTDEGVCSKGIKTCAAGTWVVTVADVGPEEETCDNLDNDCDGATDEGGVCPEIDSDNDGVPDHTDKCANTTQWFAEELEKKHYDSSNINFTETYGCGCDQILACKPGLSEGEYKSGCSQGTINVWSLEDAEGWASNCKPKEPKKQSTPKKSRKKVVIFNREDYALSIIAEVMDSGKKKDTRDNEDHDSSEDTPETSQPTSDGDEDEIEATEIEDAEESIFVPKPVKYLWWDIPTAIPVAVVDMLQSFFVRFR